MEGLETLVAPSHHAFLLTESAAQAHYNVLSFDTCLFKATSTSSTANFGALHHGLSSSGSHHNNSSSTSPLHHHHHHHQQQQSQQQHNNNNNNNNNNSSVSGSGSSSTNTQHTTSITSISVVGSSGGHNLHSLHHPHHPHLSLLSSTGVGVISETPASAEDGLTVHAGTESQTGDLNTPVTTSGDIPSFFGPSTVVEPPPITGKSYQSVFLYLI